MAQGPKLIITKTKKIIYRLLPLVFGSLVVILAFLFGNEIGIFRGFPKGFDAYGHMSLGRIFRDSFPYLYWNRYWDSGTTLLVRSYPPLTYLVAALLSHWFAWEMTTVFINLAIAGTVLVLLGVLAIVRRLTGRWLAALLGVLLVMASPAFWATLLEGGLYPRFFALAPLVWSWFFVWQYLKKEKRFWGGRYHFLSVLMIFIAISTHQLTLFWLVLTLTLLIFVGTAGRFTILKRMAWLFGPALLLGAFYYLPLVSVLGQNPPSWGRFPDQAAYRPVTLVGLFKPVSTLSAVPLILIPLALISVLLRFGQKPDKTGRVALKFNRVMIIGALFSLVYALGLFFGFIHGVYPHHFLLYFVIFTSLFTSVSYGLIQSKKLFDRLLLVMICAVVMASWPKLVIRLKEQAIDYQKLHAGTFADIVVEPGSDYRFGNADEVVAGWFNSEYLQPQTRDYYPFGPLFPAWQYYFEENVWKQDDNPHLTGFLLDWYAVRDFYVNSGSSIEIGNRGKFYEAGYQVQGKNLFRFSEAGPILVASEAPAVAVVASQETYDLLIKSLGRGGVNSQQLIPFWVGRQLSDLGRLDLKGIKTVVLAGFTGDPDEAAAKRLEEYVRQGGNLIIEQSHLEYGLSRLPDPWPVGRIMKQEVELTKIQFKTLSSEDGRPEISFKEGFWPVEKGSDVKNWAQVVATADDQPILVIGQLGQGQIIWSGLNLPGLSKDLSGNNGSNDFWLALLAGSEKTKASQPEFQTVTVNSQHRQIKIDSKARGILFKESYYSAWQADAVCQTGFDDCDQLKVYPAGPMMMYVPLPDFEPPLTVDFKYRLSATEIAGLLVSSISGLVFIGIYMHSALWTLFNKCRHIKTK